MRQVPKLGLKLVSIVLIFVFIPLTLTYVITRDGSKRILTDKIKIINENSTNAAYFELERFFNEAKVFTEELGKSDTVGLFMAGMGMFIADDLKNFQSKYPWITKFEIIAEDGTYTIYPEEEIVEGTDLRLYEWYQITKNADKFMVIPPKEKDEQFRLTVPIRFSYNDEVAGCLALFVDTNYFANIMQNYGIEDGSMSIVSASGIVLTSDQITELNEESFSEYSFFQDSLATEELLFGSYSFANQKRLTFTKFLSDWDSVLLLQIPENIAFSDIYGLLNGLKWVAIITMIIVLGVTILITKYWITNKIVTVVESAAKIADGDLQEEIKVKGNDEIGNLASSFNEMTNNLRDLIQDILKDSDEVAKSSDQIFKSAEISNQITVQVSSSIQQVAAGADSQTGYIDEVNEKLINLSQSIDGLTETTRNVQDIALTTQKKANLGAESVNRVITQMDVIQKSISESSNVINDMTKAADEIGNFVNMIDSIANQTNLLALNAAIEAARAGEEGRGFAVVAGEIRSLAEEVSVSAGKIRQLVEITQNYSHQASGAMAEGAKQIELGQEAIHENGKVYNEIFESFEQTLTAIQRVNEMTTDVAESTGQIVRGAENIAGIAQENAASAEEVSALTEEQSAAVAEITRLSESLAELSNSLRHLVQKFRV